jgi:vitamin B12 transporter
MLRIANFCPALILFFASFPALSQDTTTAQPAHATSMIAKVGSSGEGKQTTDTLQLAATNGSVACAKDNVSLLDSIPSYSILVTASRRAQPSDQVTDDHQVIEVDSAGRNTSKSPVELLEDNIPAWINDYGSGQAKTISLRGAGSHRTLILIDGAPLASTENDAGGDLGNIPPEIIQRIEVLEGGQSALYGMDAMGGVVNIITKQPQSDKVSGSCTSTLGAYEPENNGLGINTQAYSFSLGQKEGGFGWFTGAGAKLSDGAYPYKDATGNWVTRTSDGADECNFFQRLSYSLNELSLGVTGSYAYRADESPGAITYPDPATTFQNIGSLSLDGSWIQSKFLTLKLNSSVSMDSVHYVDTNSLTHSDSKNTWNNANLELLQDFTLGDQRITTGVDALRHSVNSNEINYHAEDQYALFGSGILELPVNDFVFSTTPGVRLDNSSLFDNQLNGKIGASVAYKGLLKPMAFFNAGTAYHNPEFSDLYWPDEDYTVGNPDLKPEHSRDWNAGLQFQQRTGAIGCLCRFSYFDMWLDDMIIWEPSPDYVWSPVNIDEASIKGVSLHASVTVAKWYSGSLDLTASHAEDEQTGKTIIYCPEYLATSSHTFTFKRFSAGIAGRYTSSVYTETDNSASLPPCIIFDGNVSVPLLPVNHDGEMRLIYDMLNMTNREHATIDGYPLPGREHRLSLRINF